MNDKCSRHSTAAKGRPHAHSTTKRQFGRSVHEVAGNGLLHRRALLGRGIMVAGAMSAGAAGALTGAAAETLTEAPWKSRAGRRNTTLRAPLALRKGRGPHRRQSKERAERLARADAASSAEGDNHAERPAFHDPARRHSRHRSCSAHAADPRHGQAAAEFTVDSLLRYPMVTRIGFLSNAAATARRCSPTSRSRPTCRRSTALAPAPNGPACRCRPCSTKPASIRRQYGSIAEGADAPHRPRSVPLKKVMDDAMVAHLPERRADPCPATAIRCGSCCPAMKAT